MSQDLHKSMPRRKESYKKKEKRNNIKHYCTLKIVENDKNIKSVMSNIDEKNKVNTKDVSYFSIEMLLNAIISPSHYFIWLGHLYLLR